MNVEDNGNTVVVTFTPRETQEHSLPVHLFVLLEALSTYAARNVAYKDNWRRMGWRGVLVRIRERSERLWDEYWDREQPPTADPDDALDLINFAAFMVRATRGETDRDGSWW